MDTFSISFIGGGNMAAALIGGLAGKLTAAANIHVVDLNAGARDRLQRQFGISTAPAIDASPTPGLINTTISALIRSAHASPTETTARIRPSHSGSRPSGKRQPASVSTGQCTR